jgi:hypothetical protein
MKSAPGESLMVLEESESRRYAAKLREIYGEKIADPRDLNSEFQCLVETKRHRLNARFDPLFRKPDLYPKRILVSATQFCTSQCPHCWVYASPESDCGLNFDDLNTIHRNLENPERPTPAWSVSGGEFFALRDFQEILGRFPIQCVYTNAFWGKTDRSCRIFTEKIAKALRANPGIDIKRFSVILSYDRFRLTGRDGRFPQAAAIARIIRMLDEALPEISIRISHAVDLREEDDLESILQELRKRGYRTEKTTHEEKNSDIRTESFACSKGDNGRRELFVDHFPVTPIGRGLFLAGTREKRPPETKNGDPLEKMTSGESHPFHQYTIGPDGGVGLYEVLYSPPVPHRLGNLLHESWDRVENRILHDPIAMTLRIRGLEPVVRLMKKYDSESLQRMLPHLRTIQQFLFLVLLNATRRLFLNAHLLREMKEENLVGCRDPECWDQVKNRIGNSDSDRRTEMTSLYGVDRCPD